MADARPTVALLPWGILYDEDYLDPIGVSLDTFCTDMTGGYLFNYVDALKVAGVRSIIVVVLRSVARVTRLTHVDTGATVLAVPPPRRLAAVRALTRSLPGRALRRVPPFDVALGEVEAYMATPSSTLELELRREGCAALICQEYGYARFESCVALGRRMNVPVFATFQGGRGTGWLDRLVRPLTMRRSAGLIIGPELEIRRVRERYKLPAAMIGRIFNPVDPGAFDATPQAAARAQLGIAADARVAVWYGRTEWHIKGLDVLMDAWAQICRERPDVDLRLLLIGTGLDAAWLRRRSAEPDMRGVHWRDEYIHDRAVLRLHLSAADVFAFPSRREGFPVAPLEAMACGVPVVAAAAPGVPDILEGGEAAGGIIVATGEVAPFAEALLALLDDPERGRRIGAAGRARVRAHFSIEAVGHQLRDFMVRRGLRLEAAADD